MDGLASFPLRTLVELVLAGRQWGMRDDDLWCHATPPGHRSRVQGWKLHISATVVSAPLVLQRAAAVLVAEECAFKFARSLDRVAELTGKDADPASAGKFITAYPRDDDHLRVLAGRLDEATAGLPGPRVLSDRPYRDGSLVHYRYGAFAGVPVLTNGGSFEAWIRAPDGSLVEDPREPRFCPPGWAKLPFPGRPTRGPRPPSQPRPVLLADRFEVYRTITTTARGGVYRAVDRQTGNKVVIKQARPHIRGLAWQGDAREGLRREAELLGRLDGLAPRPVTTFEKDANVFLVMEELAGQPLSLWLRGQLHRRAVSGDGEGVPAGEVLALTARLADLVDAVHARGLVYRDLTADNVMLAEDGRLRLVDAELAAVQGEWVAPAHTPGFGAPEIAPAVGPAPQPSADHYSLGALLFYVVTGVAPGFAPDSVPARPACDRMAELLRYAGASRPAVRMLAPAVLGLTDPQPARRWSTTTLREWLATCDTSGHAARPSAGGATDPDRSHAQPHRWVARLEPERQQRLLDDGLAYLVARSDTTSRDRLFPPDRQAANFDPCGVQHGAAGVLAVLTRASQCGAGGPAGQPMREVVARVARWIDERLMNVPRFLPGLYFGRTGTAWALYDAADLLGEETLASRALLLARSMPLRWPCPDVCHGTAGAGMAYLHLWHRSGEAEFGQRVQTCIDAVLETAVVDEGRVCWPVPDSFDTQMAGVSDYGFAHGIAGVGAFLLAAGLATGRDDAIGVARRAGDTLAAGAIRHGQAAHWPNRVRGPNPRGDLRYHWCNGASGVGTFLVRLWRATGDQSYLDLARAAAVTVRCGRWTMGTVACHGLAGNAEFLLDMAQACDGPYHEWAQELAACLYARHAVRDRRMVVTDALNTKTVSLAYNTGMAGPVGFLLRLRHGGQRWWMADHAFQTNDEPPDPGGQTHVHKLAPTS